MNTKRRRHAQSEHFDGPHRLCQGLDLGPEPSGPSCGARSRGLHHDSDRDRQRHQSREPARTRRVPQSVGRLSGHAGFRGCIHAMSCDAAMTRTCHHRPISATAPHFSVLPEKPPTLPCAVAKLREQKRNSRINCSTLQSCFTDKECREPEHRSFA